MNITVEPVGRTGNRLFQYALGLILARDKQCNFFAESIPYFDKISYGERIHLNQDVIRTSMFGNFNYDYDFLLKTNNDIIIDSYVQKSDLLVRNREYLQDIFETENTLNSLPSSNELVIHIRETDYKALDFYLGDNIYIDFIQNSKFEINTIVTDNIESPLIKELAEKYNCNVLTKQSPTNWHSPFFSKNELDDFNYLKYSKNAFISQSTFSWWAVFLNKDVNVTVPYRSNNSGVWKLTPDYDDIDLFVSNNNWKRYIV